MKTVLPVLLIISVVAVAGCSGEGGEEGCTPEDTKKCYDGDVYWYDSCGNRGDLAQKCEWKEGEGEGMGDLICEDGECVMAEETTGETGGGTQEPIEEEEEEQNEVEKATSLDLKVKKLTNGDVTSHDRYRYKNTGEEDAKLRIESLSSPLHQAWILDNEEDKGWSIMEDGEVKTFSEMDKNFSETWDRRMQTFESWRGYVETNWESGKTSYSYSFDSDTMHGTITTTITIHEVKVDPDIPDSVFEASN